MNTYCCVYLGSLVLSILLTPLVIRLARRIGAVDQPGIRSVHKLPVPRIGGVAIFLSATALITSVVFLDNNIGQAFRNMRLQLITLLSAATFIFLVGLIDDLRGLPARCKFVAELLVTFALCLSGIRISEIALTEHWVLPLGACGGLLTVLWIVGITNAVNLSDGLDGLAAGVSAVACGTIAIFALHSGDVVMGVLMLALLGSLSGFLVFNFNPAKVFMGDCGSLFLGFAIAASSVLCVAKSAALVGLALPALALGVPIFDTLFSMLRRFLERRSLFAPDRSHFHHRLLDLGLHQRHAVITIYLATLLATGLGLFMMVSDNASALIVFGCILLLIVLLFRVVGEVRLDETIAGLQQKYRCARQDHEERRTFEHLQLRFQQVRDGKQWWQAVCEAADRMGFAWVSLTTTYKDGRQNTEIWETPYGRPDPARVVTMTIPFQDDDSDSMQEFEIAIRVNGSFESAGHRGTLFSRLLDEYRVATGDRQLSLHGKLLSPPEGYSVPRA